MRPSQRPFAILLLLTAPAFGGEFDRLEADRLQAISALPTTKRLDSLSLIDLEKLPQALKDERSTFLVLKTDQGNYTRLLVSQALRKAPGSTGKPLPVVLLERFETFQPGKASNRVARGTEMVLFDGFQVDLDAGIVVPDNQGADLSFATASLIAKNGASLFTLGQPLPIDLARTGPLPGQAVIPSDFNGRYRLQADGRWTGVLDLQAGEGRSVSGHFRSDEKGTSYEVKGEIAVDVPHKLTFTIRFPRTEQSYEAYLWTEGKTALSGTVTMQERTFGFVAVREGTGDNRK